MLQTLLILFSIAFQLRSISSQELSPMHLPISSISESRLLRPGDDVNITCQYSSQMGSYHRKWVFINDHNSTDIASNDRLSNDFGERYTVSTSPTLSERNNKYRKYDLFIKDLQPSDSGKYQCDIFFPDGKKASMWTYILVFPLMDYVQVLDGDDAYLECFPKTFMVSHITWRTNSKAILDGSTVKDSLLTIPSVGQNFRGLYDCEGEIKLMNSEVHLSEKIHRSIYLDVVPLLEVQVHNSIVIRPVGYNVNLTCFVYSLPNVTVQWLKRNGENKHSVSSTVETYITDNKMNNLQFIRKVTVSVFSIKQITLDDYDDYECMATSDFGREYAAVTLKQPF